MKRIALSKRYMFKIASYRNYKELQKIAAVGPGVIVGGPNSGLILPPSTRPEDNLEEGTERRLWSPLDSYLSPSIQPERPPERRITNEEEENLEQMGVEQSQEETPALSLQEPVSFEEEAATDKYSEIEPMSQKNFEEYVDATIYYMVQRGEEDSIFRLMAGAGGTDFLGRPDSVAGKLISAYEEGDLPPAVGKMLRLISKKNYEGIRRHFNELWGDLVAHHRSSPPFPRELISPFRQIDTIVRNL